jgi:hypothetical protein
LQMLFYRYLREDLRGMAYIAISVRIFIAVIGTWAVVVAIMAIKTISVAADPYLILVGFVIGFFPKVAWQFIQMAAAKGEAIILPSMQSHLPLNELEGLTTWHESRLEEEDIQNIPNMATADIIDLMISTRISPERIIDWVDQSILLTHLGPEKDEKDEKTNRKTKPRRAKLRLEGVYTATSLIKTFEQAQLEPRKDGREVEDRLSEAVGGHIRSFIDTLKTEDNLRLICAWRGIQFSQ